MNVDALFKEIEEYNNKMIEIRRKIHENPELSYEEFETAKLIADTLESYGIEVKRNVGGTGVVGLIKGKDQSKTIGLRADTDALPVAEKTGLPFASKKEGVMHACGHDNHVAMLLAAAYVLSKHKDELKHNVKFLFQPAEEDGGKGGALPMIEDGALENPHVDHVFGLHIVGDFPTGQFALRGGAEMAGPDAFNIKITGKGGHGSAPDHALDPIFVGNQVVSAIYGLRSRFLDQRQPLTISVCNIHSGTKDNIIPDELTMAGTIRTLDEKFRALVKESLKNLVTKVAESYGATAEVSFKPNGYPVTYNDPEITKQIVGILKQINGTEVIEIEPIMGAEDVSRFMEKAPGTYYFLGTRNDKKGITAPNHNAKFTSDEDSLKYGALSHVLVALGFEY